MGGTILDYEKIADIPDPPPTAMPTRHSKRLSEKRGGQEYRSGQIGSLASKRNVIHINLDRGIPHFSFDILNLLPNQTLLEFAQICNIDLGDTKISRTQNIKFIRCFPLGTILLRRVVASVQTIELSPYRGWRDFNCLLINIIF